MKTCKAPMLIAGLFIIILNSCSKDDAILNSDPQTQNLETNRNRSSEGLPYSDNQIVIRYKEGISRARKEELKAQFFVEDETPCMCNDSRINLWTLDTEHPNFIDVETSIATMDDDDGASKINGDVIGDYQFLFNDKDLVNIPLNTQITDQNTKTFDSNNPSAIHIAVIDTGVDYNYFNGSFLFNTTQVEGLHGDCETRTKSGWNFVGNNGSIRDDHGHGTMMTKIIANELDARGVHYSILPVKAFDKNGEGSYFNLLCALSYVEQIEEIDIINMSFGWGKLSSPRNVRLFNEMIEEIGETKLMISSAGNKGDDTNSDGNEHFPSNYATTSLLTVGGYKPAGVISISSDGNISGIVKHEKSNFGRTSIDLMSPYSYTVQLTQDSGQLGSVIGNFNVSGTSASTAYVSARAAYLLSENTSLLPFALKNNVIYSGYRFDGNYSSTDFATNKIIIPEIYSDASNDGTIE